MEKNERARRDEAKETGVSKMEEIKKVLENIIKNKEKLESDVKKIKYCFNKLENYAEREGIKLTEVIQKSYEIIIREGDLGNARDLERNAREKGIELKLKPEIAQKGYYKLLAQGNIFDASFLDSYAKNKGIELKFKPNVVQKIYEWLIRNEEYEGIKKLYNYAKEKRVKLEFKSEVAQETYDTLIASGDRYSADYFYGFVIDRGMRLKEYKFKCNGVHGSWDSGGVHCIECIKDAKAIKTFRKRNVRAQILYRNARRNDLIMFKTLMGVIKYKMSHYK
jgi:hypothetical protein